MKRPPTALRRARASRRHSELVPGRPQGDIAIVGMAALFPGAATLDRYWQNIVSKVDAIGDPPDDWEPELFFDPDSTENDRTYCKRGGYLGDLARFDPLEFGVMPTSIDGGEPDQFLALRVAYEALADADYLDRPIDRKRAEVVIGRGTYINRGFTTVVQHGLAVDQALRILKQLHPEHTDEELQTIKRELKASLPPFNAEMAPALVPNIMSGRIANRLDLMGPNYTVDAACASSLIAVDRGMQDLLGGRCDLALVGGVHCSTPAPILMIFSQLNALSRRGELRPFDADADGTLLGEGAGFVVLKRREDAERDGDRIYALLKGIGTASDGRALGLLAPRVEGEELALRGAYEETGVNPRTVSLIEAHGTGTPVGDVAEIEALRRVFGERNGEPPWCAVGSVKSMISHLIPAAGMAGMIKTALALYHKVLPPTLHCERPNPKLELEKTPFYLNTETRPWIHGGPAPRRAGVNAFGFGGINAHAILEEYTGPTGDGEPSDAVPWDSEVVVLHASSREALVEKCRDLRGELSRAPTARLVDVAYGTSAGELGRERLSLVASSTGDLLRKLDHALQRLEDRDCERIKDAAGVYFFSRPLGRDGELAFLFPGEGSQYTNMFADLCLHFPEVRAWFDLLDRTFAHDRGYLPSQVIFPPPPPSREEGANERLWQMDVGPEAIFAANQALATLLARLEIRPDAVVGHSTGEYSALLASGAQELGHEEELVENLHRLNRLYSEAATEGEIPEAALMTVGAVGREVVTNAMGGSADVRIAMDNCPHQIVLCGTEAGVEAVAARLREHGAVCARLPFNRAYHTPAFEPFAGRVGEFLRGLRFRTPATRLYSCTTAGEYPTDPDAIRELAAEHWARPVRFRETIEAMYGAGARIFVEVGPRSNLTGFVGDILRGRPHLAVPSNVEHRSGVTQLNHLLALLAAHGVHMRLDRLYERRAARPALADDGDGAGGRGERPSLRLATGLQPMRLRDGAAATEPRATTAAVAQDGVSSSDRARRCENEDRPDESPSTAAVTGGTGDRPGTDSRARVMSEYFRTMERFVGLQGEVMQAFLGDGRAPDLSTAHRVEEPRGAEAAEPVGSAEGAAAGQASEVGPPQAAAAPASELDPAASGDDVAATLLELVSERTGYPVEMLDLGANLEADLGVDSIKRVEILGALRRRTRALEQADLDVLSRVKTLAEIVDFVAERSEEAPNGGTASDAEPSTGALPFIREVLSHSPDHELVARCELDLDEDLYLRDHTLESGPITVTDEALVGLPVMPLTMSMEMLAEAAALLEPGKTVVGMRDVSASRWIALEDHRLALEIHAKRASDDEVEVQIREAQGGVQAARPPLPIVEGTVLLGAPYPDPPRAEALALRGERPSRWPAGRMYDGTSMFHGPAFQVVDSVERTGEDGSEAVFVVPPDAALFRSHSEPRFLADPVVLDAMGQVVAYWTGDRFDRGTNIFPFKLERLTLHGPRLRPGERAKCLLRVTDANDEWIRSNIDVVDSQGSVRIRMVGWEDRRMDLPPELRTFLSAPTEVFLSRPWEAPLERLPSAEAFRARVATAFPNDLLDAYGGIWLRVLAHIALSRAERAGWRELHGAPARRRLEWLLGRLAAKDAVRVLLSERAGIDLALADVEIRSDEHGRPLVGGAWLARVARPPVVSIAHCAGTAVALAGDVDELAGVGIDVETVGRVGEEVETVAFTPGELGLLRSLGGRERGEWPTRLWCAKEAVTKAIGRGAPGPLAIEIRAMEAATGSATATVASGEGAPANGPDGSIVVETGCENGFVFATSLVRTVGG